MLFTTIYFVSCANGLRFRHMHPAAVAGEHGRHRWFIDPGFSTRRQDSFDDLQDQPQADQDNNETQKLTHTVIFGVWRLGNNWSG